MAPSLPRHASKNGIPHIETGFTCQNLKETTSRKKDVQSLLSYVLPWISGLYLLQVQGRGKYTRQLLEYSKRLRLREHAISRSRREMNSSPACGGLSPFDHIFRSQKQRESDAMPWCPALAPCRVTRCYQTIPLLPSGLQKQPQHATIPFKGYPENA